MQNSSRIRPPGTGPGVRTIRLAGVYGKEGPARARRPRLLPCPARAPGTICASVWPDAAAQGERGPYRGRSPSGRQGRASPKRDTGRRRQYDLLLSRSPISRSRRRRSTRRTRRRRRSGRCTLSGSADSCRAVTHPSYAVPARALCRHGLADGRDAVCRRRRKR